MTISAGGAAALLVAALVVVAMRLRSRAAGKRRQGASPRAPGACRAWSTVVLALFSACVVAAVGLAFAPVRATGERSGTVVVETDPAPIDGPASVPTAEMSIRITADGEVRMTVPDAISMAAEQQLPGVAIDGWSPSSGEVGAFLSESNDNLFSIDGRFATLDLQFATDVEGTSITIDTGDELRQIPLDPDAPEQQRLSIRSGAVRELASTTFMWSSNELRFSEPVSATEWSAIGLLPVDATPIRDGAGSVIGVRIGLIDTMRALAESAVKVLLLGAVGVLLLAIGFVVATAVGPRIDTAGALSRLRFASYGVALSMLIVGAANYVLPARYAVWLLAPLLVIGLIRLDRTAGANTPPRGTSDRPVNDLSGTIVTIVAVAAIHCFWFMLSARWSLGFLQTDVFDTFNVTNLFWQRSGLDASIAFGDGFRMLDYTGRAAVWGTMLERPSDAIVVFRLLLAVIVAALAAGLVARLGYRAWTQVVVGVLVSGSSAFVGLYAEGYMSREFFVSWMLIGLLIVGHQLLDDDRRLPSWWRVGVVGSVSLVIVPPYFVLAPAFILALLVSSVGTGFRQELRRWRGAAAGVTLAIVILGFPNLFWLRSSSDASQYIDTLNSLVRNIGVPFYDSLRFPAAMLGLIPFHHQDGYPLGGTTIQLGPLRWDTDLLSYSPLVTGFIVIAAGIFVLAMSILVLRSRGVTDRAFATMWAAVVLVYLAGLLVLRLTQWEEQTYFTVMWIWTLAPVALSGLAFVCLEAGRLQPRLRATMLGTVGLFALVNFVSAAGESVLWTASPYSELAPRWHYDLAVPLDRFHRELQSGGLDLGSDRFAVVIDRPSSLTGTDDDRVLTNVLVNLLEAEGARCVDCQRNADFYWVTASTDAPADTPIVLVGSTDCNTRPPLYADEFFAVCGPADQ